MKRLCSCLAGVCFCILFLFHPGAAAAEMAQTPAQEIPSGENTESEALPDNASGQKAEWTVLFYFCGSDLESRHGYASEDLQEIMSCLYHAGSFLDLKEIYGEGVYQDESGETVNVLIQTGGTLEWKINEADGSRSLVSEPPVLNPHKLQRWEYIPLLKPDAAPEESWGGISVT